MTRYNWHQLIKLGKARVLELAKELGVYELAIAPFEKKQRGAYFKAASIVYRVLKSFSALLIGKFNSSSTVLTCSLGTRQLISTELVSSPRTSLLENKRVKNIAINSVNRKRLVRAKAKEVALSAKWD